MTMRAVLLLAGALVLSGCAGDPDATLLGVVMVPPKGLPGQHGGAIAQSKPAVPSATPASSPAYPGRPDVEPSRSAPSGPTQLAGQDIAPIAYADSVGGSSTLKTNEEVNATEAELRRLAERGGDDDGRGLWNAKIRDLLDKRDRHVDDAIKKIQEDEAQ